MEMDISIAGEQAILIKTAMIPRNGITPTNTVGSRPKFMVIA